MRIIAAWLSLCAFVLVAGCTSERATPVAYYALDEGSGTVVRDSSGHHLDGAIVGASRWTRVDRKPALVFNGTNRIRIPSSAPIDLRTGVTVSAWIRGTPSPLTFKRIPIDVYSLRAPFFQVAGDTIYYVSNTDFKGKEWDVWTGTVDTELNHFSSVRRTFPPYSGCEPKLLVTPAKIYYEFFGQDHKGVWQIFTPVSNIDGSHWTSIQRTHEASGERTEQDFNIQAGSGRIYYAYPKEDAKDAEQLYTAFSNLDGSGYKEFQRTTGGAWLPRLDVYGSKVYYEFTVITENEWIDEKIQYHKKKLDAALLRRLHPERVAFASANLDGSGFHIFRIIPGDRNTFPNFVVTRGRIHFITAHFMGHTPKSPDYIFTGSMKLDGSDLRMRQRTFGANVIGTAPELSIQAIGDRIYYAFATKKGAKTTRSFLASADFDDNDWRVEQLKVPSDRMQFWYKSLQIVGGKAYFGIGRFSARRQTAFIGTAGANIVNKGDAFGIGLTLDGKGRAFVNAGPDYLFREETTPDRGGAVAEAMLDGAWHHVVMTYDGTKLTFYVDGVQKASMPYAEPIGSNPFPLVIGDGFHGVIRDVAVYNRALSAAELAQNASSK